MAPIIGPPIIGLPIIRPPIGLPPIGPGRPFPGIPTIPLPPPGVPAPSGPDDLAPLRFRAETNPDGPAIDLVWELPDPTASPDSLPLVVLRRIRRFPGSSRRGIVPVQATTQDLGEGDLVYDSSTVDWDFEETREDVIRDGRASVERQLAYRGTPRGRVVVRTIRREQSPAGAVVRTTIRFVDRSALEPGTIYYYTAFVGPQRRFSRRTQSSAIATGADGPELVPLLPRIDRQRDTEVPNPAAVPVPEQGRGQLERLVRTVEAHSDMLLGFVKGLRDLHAVRRVDSRLLPAMAAQIGWKLTDYLTEEGQRAEIAFAPDVQHTLGTTRNVARMVHRATGWTVRVREFARNVALSWDGSRVERIDTGRAYLDASVRAQGTPPVLQLSHRAARLGRRRRCGGDDPAADQGLRRRDRVQLRLRRPGPRHGRIHPWRGHLVQP